MRFFPVFLLLAMASGCVVEERHPHDYPIERRHPAPVRDKLEEPYSQVWPLSLWLEEFSRRNGVVVQFDDRDVAEMEIVRPTPGPHPDDATARAALVAVARQSGLVLTEPRPHLFRLQRSGAIVH
jgi:hypothetical protein